MCVSFCKYVLMITGTHEGQKRVFYPRDLEVRMVLSCPLCTKRNKHTKFSGPFYHLSSFFKNMYTL